MYIKIYFGNKPLFLCDEVDKTIQPFIHHDDAVFIDELNIHTVKSMIHEMEQPAIHAGVFFHPDLEELKKAVFKKFTVIRAGGGLVRNERGEILLIFRRGKWDLPKGKLDPGEKLEDCALREVKEETGIKVLNLESSLAITYHTYHEGSRFILKESHWYAMNSTSEEELKPQTDEDIHDIKWVDPGGMRTYLDNSFPAIKDLLSEFAAKQLR